MQYTLVIAVTIVLSYDSYGGRFDTEISISTHSALVSPLLKDQELVSSLGQTNLIYCYSDIARKHWSERPKKSNQMGSGYRPQFN